MPTAIELIAAERTRQVKVEGYTSEHDDTHDLGELALAAALYALPYDSEVGGEPLLSQDDFINLHIALETGCDFFVKPESDNVRRLVKAGALIVAEIERIQRAETAPRGHSPLATPDTLPCALNGSSLTDSEKLSEILRIVRELRKMAPTV